MTFESPMLAIRRALAYHDTRFCDRGPTLGNIVIGHLNRGWYIVAITDPGVVYYLRMWHRCDQEQSWWLLVNSGSQKNKFRMVYIYIYIHIYIYIYIYIYITLSFNLVEVLCTAIYILFHDLMTWTSYRFSCITSIVNICLVFRLFKIFGFCFVLFFYYQILWTRPLFYWT